MDTVLAVAIVALAAFWGVSRLFRRRPSGGSHCSSGCAGCPLAGRGVGGSPGCGAVPATVHAPDGAGARDALPSWKGEAR